MSELKITSRTRLLGIIGNNIKHSLSPVMHNAGFEAIGFDAVYLAFQVQPAVLLQAMEGFRTIGLLGLSVTIPHKIAVMKHLDELDDSASTLGAVNTIVNREGKLIGYNTDGTGALAALKEAGVDLGGKRVLLLGSGGAARALAFMLAERAERLTILNRTVSKAESLAEDVRRATRAAVTGARLDSPTLNEEIAFTDLLVNSTSVGMNPRPGETLVDAHLLRPDMAVFDIVYSPLETRLLKEAGNVGAKRIDGLAMLLYQGVEAFELWTGEKAPVSTMREALRDALRVDRAEEQG